MAQNIKVCCRFRPLPNKKGEKLGVIFTENEIEVDSRGKGTNRYSFDKVFSDEATQEEVFEKTTEGIISDVMDGYNATIFTYGQTGCLSKGTKVLMYSCDRTNGGFSNVNKKIEDVKIGDMLMGDDSTPRIVSELIRGRSKMFEIVNTCENETFSYTVNTDHILTLYDTIEKKILDVPLRKFVLAVGSCPNGVLAFGSCPNGVLDPHSVIGIDRYKGVKTSVGYAERSTFISPYSFGALLALNPEMDCIPEEFLLNSTRKRISLLCGFLYEYGYNQKECDQREYETPKNFYSLCIRENILDDIMQLVRSLGYTCSYEKSSKEESPSTLNIWLEQSMYDISIFPVGEGEYYGVTIDKNQRFLLSDFTITHNSGKTHTLTGTITDKGIIPRVIKSIFDVVDREDSDVGISTGNKTYTITASFVEIYLEKLRDLLAVSSEKISSLHPEPLEELKIREGGKKTGIWIENVIIESVTSPESFLKFFEIATMNRSIGETKMNATSSRSHSLVILDITQTDFKAGIKKTSKLFIVDLAGSEKVKKTAATGITLLEAQYTNKSLTTLGMVIKNLTENASHIPYRDSKLTRILTDSLGGNSKTCLIITCSSDVYNLEETISTLRFGSRVKTIKNKATVNIDTDVSEYKRLLAESYAKIKMLEEKTKVVAKSETKERTIEICIGTDGETYFLNTTDSEELEETIKNLMGKISECEKEVIELRNENVGLLSELEIEREKIKGLLNVPVESNVSKPSEATLRRMLDGQRNLCTLFEDENTRLKQAILDERKNLQDEIDALKRRMLSEENMRARKKK